MRSLSEIDTTAKRATKAIGFSWGIAEEVGKNSRLLEMFGLPGIRNLNYYFKVYKKHQFQKISLISKKNISKIPYCPIITGTNFLDQAYTIQEHENISFDNIAFPILFLPFVSRASEIIGKKILLSIDENILLLNFNHSILSNANINNIIELGKVINIKFIENENSFTESEWKELYNLSEDTFVEETEESKQNTAGAGVTDND